MEKFGRILVVICVMASMSQTYGSDVEMTATPGFVKPFITPSLSLLCLMNDTGSSVSGGLVGPTVTSSPSPPTTVTSSPSPPTTVTSSPSPPTTVTSSPSPPTNVTSSPSPPTTVTSSPSPPTVDNSVFLQSLTIIRKGHGPIARITVSTPAEIVGQVNIATVAGDLTGASGDGGHLSVTWTDPMEDVEGTYICEVNGLTAQGDSIVLNKTVAVYMDDPTMTDVVKNMYSLTLSNRDMTSKITQLEGQITNCQQETTDLLHELTLVNATSRHVESAELSCYDATFSNGGTTTRHFDRDVTFAHAYDRPPAMIVIPVQVDSVNSDDAGFYVELLNVTSTGFTLRCSALYASQIRDMTVRWTSTAQ